jgi:hypothetical protein
MVSSLDLIADKYMQRYPKPKPIPDTGKITVLSIILRRLPGLPDFKKAATDLEYNQVL